MLRKLFLILITSTLFLNTMMLPTNSLAAEGEAENSWYNQSFPDWHNKVYGKDTPPNEIFGERYTAAQVQWIIYSLFSTIIDMTGNTDAFSCITKNSADLSACKDALTKPSGTAVNYQEQSLTTLVFEDRGFSGIKYIKDKLSNYSLIPVTHAQAGFGFDALKPIQDMWRASRDLSFGLFILVIIIFSFMIMFRVKISPQVVISAQSAIPKVVGSLIFVTFSYAIAGLLVDLLYVVIGLLSAVLSSFVPQVISSEISSSVIFSLLTKGQPIGGLGINIQLGILGLIGLYVGPLIIGLLLLTLIVGAASATTLVWIPLILLVVVIVVTLWISIKTIWALMKAFANIILLTIFAPLQVALGVIVPNMGPGAWIKSYISHLSVFVVTGVLWFLSVLFLIQGFIIGTDGLPGAATFTQAALNPILGTTNLAVEISEGLFENYTTWPPLLGTGSAQGIGILFLGVSFVLFTLIPKATEIVQGLITGKPYAYGSAIGEAVSPITTGLGATAESMSRNGVLPYPLSENNKLNQWYNGLDDRGKGRIRSIASFFSPRR